jgi:plastocyanin
LAAIAVGLACAGGGEGSSERPAASEVRAAEPVADHAEHAEQGGATIRGSAKFTGAKPTNSPIDMSEEPQCKAKYQTPPRAETAIVNANGTLGNVFVYVKSGLPATQKYTAPATPVVVDQDGCRYRPHVLGVMVGQAVEIRNSDPLLHNIKATGRAAASNRFNISQPRAGMKTTRTFSASEVMVPLECNVHGWMNAFVGVLPHPFYAVTGTDGAFSIKGLPPGTYTVEAWHEKFGTRTATVTVAGTETKTADLTFAAK